MPGLSDQQRAALAWEWENRPEKRPELERYANEMGYGSRRPDAPRLATLDAAGEAVSRQFGGVNPVRAARNLPGSAKRMASDLWQAVTNPIETAKAVVKSLPGIPAAAAGAVRRAASDPRGAARGASDWVEENPAEMLALGAALVPGAHLGSAARLAARGAASTARATGRGASHVLGMSTGAHTRPIREAFDAARAGDAGTVLKGMTDPAAGERVAEMARARLRAMREGASGDYRAGMDEVLGEVGDDRVDMMGVARQIDDAVPSGKLHNKVFNPGQAQVKAAVRQALSDFMNLKKVKGKKPQLRLDDPLHTVRGLDALRKRIWSIKDATEPNTAARAAANAAYKETRRIVADAAPPEYRDVLAAYAKAKKTLDDIEKEFSLGERANPATPVGKLQSVMRNDVNSRFGARARMADALLQGTPGVRVLAGEALAPVIPRGIIGRTVAPAMGVGALMNPGMVATLPFMSPRLMGRAALAAGSGARRLAGVGVPSAGAGGGFQAALARALYAAQAAGGQGR